MFDIPINKPVSIASDYPALMCGIVQEYKVVSGDPHHGSYIYLKLKEVDYYVNFDPEDDERFIVTHLPQN